ncbi:dihydrolipoyl dehydrogenase, partial [Chloroflexota bacterium]
RTYVGDIMDMKRIAVIGGGPAGYTAAIQAAQLGGQVTLIEKDALGGTCLNRGCIPTKALLHSANVFWKTKHSTELGLNVDNVSMDYPKALKRTQEVVKRLVGGLGSLMVKNKITVIEGSAYFKGSSNVYLEETDSPVEADSIVIAAGSKVKTVPIEGIDGSRVIGSNEALVLPELPKSAVVIGGGAIGLEFAQMWNRMGASVAVVEVMPQLIPGEDVEIAEILKARLIEEGVRVYTGAKVNSIMEEKDKALVSFVYESGDGQEFGEYVLLAVGREPATDGLGLNEAGINVQNGAIVVGNNMQTNIDNVYAAGDVTGGVMLAHVAMAEAKCAVHNAFGEAVTPGRSAVPRCVYSIPEVASVGLTQEQASAKHDRVKIGKFPFLANGRSLVLGETIGMAKVVADAKHGEILGVHIIGPGASELIAEAVLAIQLEATVEDLASTIHAHPTLSEVTMEAALGVGGRSIHI